MLVFIDESGDAGFKLTAGSSPHFVVSLIVFSDNELALRADAAVDELRIKLKLRPDFEFHFNKLKHEFRHTFLTGLREVDFQYFSVVIDKKRLRGEDFQIPGSFYKYACALVCSNAKKYLKDAHVIIH